VATAGGPSVRNANASTPLVDTFPARSSKPGATEIVKAVSGGSFWAGVKIAVEPS
jgi:hypothetical protein